MSTYKMDHKFQRPALSETVNLLSPVHPRRAAALYTRSCSPVLLHWIQMHHATNPVEGSNNNQAPWLYSQPSQVSHPASWPHQAYFHSPATAPLRLSHAVLSDYT